MNVADKVVIVTGASEGIGAACAQAFRRKGALISLNARSEGKLRRVAQPDGLVTAGDITQTDVREALIARTIERFGRIDILVNNAGAGIYYPAWRAPLADARRLFELNFFAPLALIQAVAPHMRARRSGTIVNVGSIAGKVTLPWMTLYSASKFALGSLTDGLRMELRRDGIHAISVCPGYVKTAFQAHALGSAPDGVVRSRRFAITADQCAAAIVRAVERRSRTVVTPAIGWMFIALERLFPGLVDRRLEAVSDDELKR